VRNGVEGVQSYRARRRVAARAAGPRERTVSTRSAEDYAARYAHPVSSDIRYR
jgi:hypothetical protein